MPQRKRVRFSDDNVVVTVESSAESTASSWWSKSDFVHNKDVSVKRLCTDERKVRRYSECLSEAYRLACSLASRVDDCLLTEEEQQLIEQPGRVLPDEVRLEAM